MRWREKNVFIGQRTANFFTSKNKQIRFKGFITFLDTPHFGYIIKLRFYYVVVTNDMRVKNKCLIGDEIEHTDGYEIIFAHRNQLKHWS
ncbi:CLUMA_CG008868, isoform A [Clunio marinus]|uniref:CLUMA_CG008868, isoform A n=1 Tax=Clunio marinus TaxID=568069 RepID=A0A1J1I555_9DIPT|nr:CLUMA_CG008868, isoform A [Clunio marinus]